VATKTAKAPGAKSPQRSTTPSRKPRQPSPPELVPPRFGTPRNPGRATYGGEVAEVARRLRKPLMPWQRLAADVALEIDPATGDLWYEEVVITVPRQSGKTTLIFALLIWRCVVMARRLGRQTCTYLAQSGKHARRKMEREFIPTLRGASGLREVAHSRATPRVRTEWKPSLNNGQEHIQFGTGSFLQVEAPTETGSHGDVLDMPVIDEAFAHQSDTVEQAVDAAGITRRSPQLYVISTAGNRRSRFLWLKVRSGRKLALEQCAGRARDSKRCYLEWSVPDDEDWQDEAVWWRFLPALGHTITVARLRAKMEKALANPDLILDEEDEEPGVPGFRRAYLNQWMEIPKIEVDGFEPEIPGEEWAACGVAGRRWGDDNIVGEVAFGAYVTADGRTAAVALAGRTSDGLIQGELIEAMPGTWWFEKLLTEKVGDNDTRMLAWKNTGSTRALVPEMRRAAGSTVPTLPINGTDWAAACQAFRTLVKDRRFVHLDDAVLDDSVAGLRRRDVSAGWEFDEPGAHADPAPLLALVAAVRAIELAPAPAEDEEVEANVW
jgi:hypothetical protein